jgi:hypothetical protein
VTGPPGSLAKLGPFYGRLTTRSPGICRGERPLERHSPVHPDVLRGNEASIAAASSNPPLQSKLGRAQSEVGTLEVETSVSFACGGRISFSPAPDHSFVIVLVLSSGNVGKSRHKKGEIRLSFPSFCRPLAANPLKKSDFMRAFLRKREYCRCRTPVGNAPRCVKNSYRREFSPFPVGSAGISRLGGWWAC